MIEVKKNRSKDFEDRARVFLEDLWDIELKSAKMNINGKNKEFDFVNIERKYVGDAKNYCNTSSGNVPNAKRSTLNEYVWLLQKLGKDYKKFIVIGEDRKMADRYVKDYHLWLDDVEIYFFKEGEIEKLHPAPRTL